MTDEWSKIKDVLKQDYPHLTEEELKQKIKTDADLLLRVSERLKKSKKEIKDWLSIMG
jgi:ppGpp synthetase/RelA/SpoT-type nucleotidyltranferase